jgi:uncharacterized protein YjeT (DUF2065 family)
MLHSLLNHPLTVLCLQPVRASDSFSTVIADGVGLVLCLQAVRKLVSLIASVPDRMARVLCLQTVCGVISFNPKC